jgi:solute carrier family 35 protein E3
VTYYDSLPAAGAIVKTTSAAEAIFAFSGVATSSVYTLWVSQYHKKLKMSSMQLLFNQMHVGAMLLAFSGQLMDTFPVWSQVSPRQWFLIFMASLALLPFFYLARGGVHAEQINRAVPLLV